MSKMFEAVRELAAAVAGVDFASVDLSTVSGEAMAELLLVDEHAKRVSTLTVDYDGARVRETVTGKVGGLRVTLASTRKATPEDLIEHAERMREKDRAASNANAQVLNMPRSAS